RGATIRAIDEVAIRRAARGPIEIVRDGNFVAILGRDETIVEAAAAVAPGHVAWDNVEALNPFQEEARWLLQQPSIDKTYGAPPAHAHRACLDRTVLRTCALQGRPSAGLDALPRGVSAARRPRAHPEARSGGDRGETRAGSRLLRP